MGSSSIFKSRGDTEAFLVATYPFANLFPWAGLAVLLFGFLSPVPWRLNPSPAMQLRPYVAPEGYLPNIACSTGNANLLAGIAALLNSTNSTALLAQNSTANFPMNVQQFFAKGGGGGDGGDALGGIIDDISSAIQASQSSSGPSSNIAPHGDFDDSPNATMRVWLGPLGTCTRDLDGRKWCTKPSYRHPIYNISSFVQPNAFLYPAIIQAQTLARTTLGFIVLAGISCVLSFFGNFLSLFDYATVFYNIVILISEFVTLWVWLADGSIEQAPGSTDPRQLNAISTLYKCNQTTGAVQLTAGPQFYVLMGNHYGLLWASWILVYVLGSIASAIRAVLKDD